MATQQLSAVSRSTDHQGQTLADRPARIAQLSESIARRALDTIGTPADARILRVVRTGTVLTVATEQPDAYLPYCVDSFRLPAPDTTDPDFDEADAPRLWTLVDQYGDYDLSGVERMIAEARAYAATILETAVAR